MARFWEIDFFRGLAVLMMIIFHALFYANYFGLSNLSLYSGLIGRFQMLIPLIFFTVSGISSSIQAKNSPKKVMVRGLKVLALGGIITLFTYLFFPESFVFFGVLHSIGACILLSALFKDKKISLIFGILLLIISPIVNNFETGYKYLSVLGLKYSLLNTFDYYPLIPWLGVFLIGYYFGKKYYPLRKPRNAKSIAARIMCFVGRHSLVIYFSHIILLFSFFYLLKNFLA